jgi:hypothetical protein
MERRLLAGIMERGLSVRAAGYLYSNSFNTDVALEFWGFNWRDFLYHQIARSLSP